MVEDIMNLYKQKCIRTYQFRFVCNGITMAVACLILGLLITKSGLIILKYYMLNVDVLGEYYLFMTSLFIAELIYILIAETYIYYKERSYVIKKITLLIEELINETSKTIMIDNLNRIKKLRFNIGYLFGKSPINKIFNKIKFDEFMEISNMNTPEIVEQWKIKIHEYSKKDRNFKEYIDVAFWGIVVMTALKPIIEYAQSVYIPNSLSSFNWVNIVKYLSALIPIVALPIFTSIFMHKYNNYNNIREKKKLLVLSEKLNDYDFNISELEKCFKEVL